jgi:hypothetical protein
MRRGEERAAIQESPVVESQPRARDAAETAADVGGEQTGLEIKHADFVVARVGEYNCAVHRVCRNAVHAVEPSDPRVSIARTLQTTCDFAQR